MPNPDQFTVFVGEGAWRLGVLRHGGVEVAPLDAPDGDDASLEAWADRAADRLNALGYAAQHVVLAIPSAWCLSAAISTDDLEGGNRRQAMAFRLEEHLPISAEDMVADYVEFNDGAALAIGADLAPLRQIVDALDARGIAVGYITPIPLLVAAAAVEAGLETDLLLINSGAWDNDPATGGYDLVELRKGRPSRWWWFADDDRALRERLEELAADRASATPITVVGEQSEPMALLRSMEAIEPRESSLELWEGAAHRAGTLAQAGAAPWVNLRCDELAMPRQFEVYRKAAGALAIAVALLLLAVAGIAQWRATHYRAIADDHEQKLVEVFKETTGNDAVPPINAIRNRMLSVRNRQAGMGGRAGDATDLLHQPSALTHLAAVLRVVNQTDLRCRLLDLNIQPDLLRLDGQARSHVEAERLAAEFRAVGRFDVDPPKTKALPERGVSFLLLARPAATDVRQAMNGGPQ